MAYETIIGLEIHVELKTKSKIFCSCSTEFGKAPNENTCPICLGFPGTLPVLNEEVVNLAIKAGKALNCKINMVNKFDRKNYYYPDLPKAYQISQLPLPICVGGYLDINVDDKMKRIGITRIHIEEDAGKLVHLEDQPITLIDYNRSGVPLIEIVTEPDIRSPEEAVAFLKALKSILEYTEVSDCRMEQGSLRCDANISLRPVGQKEFNKKVEIKNMNSFKEILKALQKEEKRQLELYEFGEGHKIKQETRKWDSAKGKTVQMRSKENAIDYRYFPDADLPPVYLEEERVRKITEHMPELPMEKKERFIREYGLKEEEIELLIENRNISNYFEEVVSHGIEPKKAANWIIVEIFRVLKEKEYGEIPVRAEYLARLIKIIDQGIISHTAGKEIFDALIDSDRTPEEIVEEKGLSQISGTDELERIIEEVISKNPNAVEDFKKGKTQAIGFLMGQTMKATKGKANPKLTKEILENKLKSLQ